jgi:HAD superfamily hydrolase (TIGR01509 family)
MTPFRAIIFDMDGVLLDSEPLHNKAWETLFAELGHGHDHGLDFDNYIGVTDRILFRDFQQATRLPVAYEELRHRKFDHLVRFLREQKPVFPELHQLLPDLRRHYQLAVATNSSHRFINIAMEITGLRDQFQTIVSGEDIQELKPAPEIYITAARRLGFAPEACCAIEDSPTGIRAAQAAGMKCIGLSTSLPAAKLAEADWVMKDHTEVRQLLLSA